MKPLEELTLTELMCLEERASRKSQQHDINKARGERLNEIGDELAEKCDGLARACYAERERRVLAYAELYGSQG